MISKPKLKDLLDVLTDTFLGVNSGGASCAQYREGCIFAGPGLNVVNSKATRLVQRILWSFLPRDLRNKRAQWWYLPFYIGPRSWINA